MLRLYAAIPVLLLALAALALPAAWAGPWEEVDPAAAGWDVARLSAALERARHLGPTAVMVVQDGRVVARQGDTSRRIEMASIRKSLLGALIGLAVADGRMSLDATLADLGIDDRKPTLSLAERQARVRDLLTSRSGIYHPAAHETASMREQRPARFSHRPGTFWYYNNWDFNALGTIYRQQTGQDIFAAFAARIAEPIGMEDFQPGDGRYVFSPASIHPAYPFRLSVRDAARFGQLILNRGRWGGHQVLPATWVAESTSPYAQTNRGPLGYGYLWWTLPAWRWGPRTALASGYGGQAIAVVPARRLLVVQGVDRADNPLGIRTSDFLEVLADIAAAAP